MKIFEKDGWDSGWRWYNFQPGHVENLLGKTIIEHKDDANRKDNTKDRNNWGPYL